MARRPIGLIPHAVRPEYSRQWYAGQGTELRRTVLRTTILSIALVAVVFGLLAVLREPMIRLILGDQFSGAAPLLPIMLLGALLVAAPFRMLPTAMGRVRPSLLSGTARLAVFLAAMVWRRLNTARQEQPGPERCPPWWPSWSSPRLPSRYYGRATGCADRSARGRRSNHIVRGGQAGRTRCEQRTHNHRRAGHLWVGSVTYFTPTVRKAVTSPGMDCRS